MPIMTVGTGTSLIRGHYHEKVLAMQPYAYWPLCESAGTAVHCLTDASMDGTYNSDVSTWPPGAGIGDGNSAPFLDGANDCIDILSASLTAAFNGNTGTLFAWGRVANAGVWTDGSSRYVAYIYDVFTDGVYFNRLGASNNTIRYRYYAGAAWVGVDQGGFTDTGWIPYTLTWDKPNDEMKAYARGVQVGATQNGLGVWGGVIDRAILGATVCTPANVWHGWIAHCALFDYVLPQPQIEALTVV